MELEQENNLISLHTIKDPIFKQAAKEKIILQGDAIQNYANSLLAQITGIENQKCITRAQLTGENSLLEIKNRLEQGMATAEDVSFINHQIKLRSSSYQRSLDLKQHRGRKL